MCTLLYNVHALWKKNGTKHGWITNLYRSRSPLSPKDEGACNSVHYQHKQQNSIVADHNNDEILYKRHILILLKEITMDDNRSPWSPKDKLVFQTWLAPDNNNDDVEGNTNKECGIRIKSNGMAPDGV